MKISALLITSFFFLNLFSLNLIGQALPEIEKLRKQSQQIVAREGNSIYIKNRKGLKKGDLVLFVRPSAQNFEILARGLVKNIKAQQTELEVDPKSLIKQPLLDDLVVSLNKPYVPPPSEYLTPPTPPVRLDDIEIPGDAGFFEVGWGNYQSYLETTASQPVNLSKTVGPYRFTNLAINWYQEYLWRLGIEYERVNGNFPTSTYFREKVNSSQRYSRYGIGIRSRRFFKDRFRSIFKVHILKDEFLTDNQDENLVSTTISGLGIGNQWEYEYQHFLWTSGQKKIGFTFQKAYLSGMLFPTFKVQDGLVSRGDGSSGSWGLEYKLGVQFLFYWKWVPVFKRWFIDMHYGHSEYNLKFSGVTKSETGGIYTITEGSTSKEVRNFVYLGLGFRFDDFIGKFFKPK